MGLRELGRRFERRYIRPVAQRIKGSGDRLALLERRVERLEALVREDLGLRYLELDAKERAKGPSGA
ncbi:MAG: hypothetical protein ACREMO_05800 [Gemmatimonadales bacterium]